MELHYALNKSILMEARETCRIPVPVERCPLYEDADDVQPAASDTAMAARCRAHLQQQVKLSWTLLSDIPPGNVNLDAESANPIRLLPK